MVKSTPTSKPSPPSIPVRAPQIEFVSYDTFDQAWWLWWYDRLSHEMSESDLPDLIALAAWIKDDKLWRIRLTLPLEDDDI